MPIEPAQPQLPQGDRLHAGRAALPAAALGRPQGGQGHRHRAAPPDAAGTSPSSSRRPRRARAAPSRWPPSTRVPTSPTWTPPARRWGTRNRSRTRRACWAATTTASSTAARSQADVETLAAHSGVPVFNGLTDEWHPTQMLADFLTMHEASGKEYRELVLRLHGRPALQHGPLAAGHGRAHGQRRAHGGAQRAGAARRTWWPSRRDIAGRTGARITITDRPGQGRQGRRLHPHRRVGLHGRAQGGLEGARHAAQGLPGQRRAPGEDAATRTSSSCTACPPSTMPTPWSAGR